jgi:cyanophycin synthetase
MKRRCYEHIVYFSTQSNNPLILNHIAREGTAVFIQNNHLTIAENGTFATIAEVSEIPLLYNGAASVNIANALAAIAASYSLGVSVTTISASLKSFFPSMNQNPGRLNMITGNDFTLLIDSGKYAAAHKELSEFVRRMEYSKIILLMSTASDQSPEDVIKSGKILSSLADETLLFNESLYTTAHDEIPLHTVITAFQSKDSGYSVHSMRSFSEALDTALKKVRSEDLILIIMQNLETITKFIGLDGIDIP